MHYYYFSLEAVLLSRLNSGDIEALGQRENSQKSVFKLWIRAYLHLNCKVFLKMSQNLREKTYARLSFSLGLSSVISKVSVADFKHE